MVIKMNVIDLFCGAGGMSTGFIEAGFNIIAAVDFDTNSVETINRNHDVKYTAVRNLEWFKPRTLAGQLNQEIVNVIVGGPPCQGFSTASMNPGAKPNYGPNSKYDERNSLYRRFFDFVDYFKPRFFVMENVPGIRSRGNGKFYRKAIARGKELGYKIHEWKLVAAQFGVPQFRRRIFLVGVKDDKEILKPEPTHHPINSSNDEKYVSVGEAILDLPVLSENDGADDIPYDKEVIQKFETESGFNPKYAKWARKGSTSVRHHISRKHNKRDLRIFKMIEPGKSSAHLTAKQQKHIPYSMKSFKDKYRKQALHQPATTITAHLSKDGLYYIHPTQTRSLTPREAARLQSFPDKYIFSGTRSSIYKQIGNAVPPLMAKAIADTILKAV